MGNNQQEAELIARVAQGDQKPRWRNCSHSIEIVWRLVTFRMDPRSTAESMRMMCCRNRGCPPCSELIIFWSTHRVPFSSGFD